MTTYTFHNIAMAVIGLLEQNIWEESIVVLLSLLNVWFHLL